MKNGMKLLAVGAAFIGAAIGVAAYRKYRDSYEQLPEAEVCEKDIMLDDDLDFEPVVEVEDDLTYYYIDDPEQIMFHE